MKSRVCGGLLAVLVVGCSSSPAALDAGPVIADAVVDAAPDAAVDAAVAPDAAVATDAGVDVAPRCATAPQVLWDAAPQWITGLAIAGDIAYVSRNTYTGATLTDGSMVAVDRRTGAEVAEVMTSGRPLHVQPTPGGALVTDGAQVWELRPAEAPVLRVSGRTGIARPATDGTNVYWFENESVYRQALAGGEPAFVMSCTTGMALSVEAGWVYCAGGQRVNYATVTGASPHVVAVLGYPIVALVVEGTSLYVLELPGGLVRIALPDGAPEELRPNVVGTRTYGLALTPTHGYTTGSPSRVFDRTTFAGLDIDAYYSYENPILVDDELYMISEGPTVGGPTRVLRCVD